ncbi:hypothetical protein E2C01_068159 [Portunus trituberculatus]|uniref:Uncharacterized protein n=1 Tax=Portunus trituberculatus TaxID=210409 RepID=A0A5B7HN58_PORTR|nr:hypothetical protein [Portunus trituberculatus]
MTCPFTLPFTLHPFPHSLILFFTLLSVLPLTSLLTLLPSSVPRPRHQYHSIIIVLFFLFLAISIEPSPRLSRSRPIGVTNTGR